MSVEVPLEPYAAASIDPSLARSLRLFDGEHVVLASRRQSWVATFYKIATFGLYVPWWRVSWFVLTNQRLIAKQGILNKVEIALPLHFVQDASMHRSWLGVGRVNVSTAGGRSGDLCLEPLTAELARMFADTIIRAAKSAARHPINETPQANDAILEGLERLAALRASGAITDTEFVQQKTRLLKDSES